MMILLLGSAAVSVAGGNIIIEDPWIPAAPPNARVMAAFMTIRNVSSKPLTITSASSSLFRKIEIHRTEMHDGVMKMVPQEGLTIPPGKSIKFSPGGYHFMLKGPSRVPAAGESVPLEISLSDGSGKHLDIPVVPAFKRH